LKLEGGHLRVLGSYRGVPLITLTRTSRDE